MEKNDYCTGCGQKQTCRDLYEKIGRTTGPNVALSAMIAFLAPIIVFIVSLAGAEKLLESWFEGKLVTFLSFLSGLCVTFMFILVVRIIRGSITKGQYRKGRFDGDHVR